MEKLDLAKEYKAYYTAKTKPELIEIPPARFISIQGKGDPSGEDYSNRIQAIYTVAYIIKFVYKAMDKDFTVPKLEGLWWYDEEKYSNINMQDTPGTIPRSEWEYRMMIRMPEYVTEDNIKAAIQKAVIDKGVFMAEHVELFHMNEGLCVQMLHKGPFDTEPVTLAKMLDFIKQHNLGRNGLHHEIYLSDYRKTAPEKLKTILREPVRQ